MYGSFGGICGGNILVGHEHDLYKYKAKKNRWNHVQGKGHVIYNRLSAQSCNLSDKLIICGGWHDDSVELLQYENENDVNKECYVHYNDNFQTIITTTVNRTTSSKMYGKSISLRRQTICPTKLPLSVKFGHTITILGTTR